MALTLYLVRHGLTDWNKMGRFQGRRDVPLNESGRRQALRLAEALEAFPLDAVYSSPLVRAHETAKMIAAAQRLAVVVDDRLTEIAHGRWEGKLASEVAEVDGQRLSLWRRRAHLVTMPEGESISQVRRRAVSFLRSVEGTTGHICVVSHDCVNRTILCHVLGLPLQSFWNIKQDNACLNIMRSQAGRWQVERLNDTCHLSGCEVVSEQAAL